ncbi:hypothetical protein VE03_09626 [Pseudogymnoascus sp. 23342-1-I1]|nr:hypothetical protein VE03_09626 [Pseudogymnoascus sp. 23342-1-I1]
MHFLSATFAALALAALTHATTADSPALSLTGTDPLRFFNLPTLISAEKSAANPHDIEAIRATLSLYPLAIDGKNFGSLSLIFAEDAVANYSAPLNVLSPLSTIQSVLEASLKPVTTQHSFGTQLIDVLSRDEAFSVTYYTATHFGRGEFEGRTATAFGQYQDVWRRGEGGWRIGHRNLVYMGPIVGDLTIFTFAG